MVTLHRPGSQRHNEFPIPKSLVKGAHMSAILAMTVIERIEKLLYTQSLHAVRAQGMLSDLNQQQIRSQCRTSA